MYYIGIDLGGTKIAAGLVDESGKIILKDSVPTLREREYPEIVKDMALLAKKIIEDAKIDIKDVKSIGIGAPGTPDTKNGILVYANNLKFRNVPMRAEMQKHIDLPIYIDNDANCAAWAESVAGAAKGYSNSMTITLGTGIGGGIILNGEIYPGFNGAAAEVGHILIMSGGELCTCGRYGCWEAYGSATGLISQTQRAAKENPDSLINELVDGDLSEVSARTAFDAAKKGDETGKMVVDQWIKYVAEGMIDLINIFTPEVLVVGGGVCNEGEYLMKPLREKILKDIYARDVEQTVIKVAQMGNDAGIIGAAMLGR